MPSRLEPRSLLSRRLETLAIAAGGTAAFWVLNLPLPFLFGPLMASLLAALARRPLLAFGEVSKAARTILGVAVGATLTPEVAHQLPQMIGSLIFVPFYIAAIGLVGMPYFHRFAGFDKATSWYASMPGGLQDMVIFGTEAGGDPRALSLIHATRVAIIVTVAPMILHWGFGAQLTNPIGEPAAALPLHEIVLMVGAAWIGWKGGERIGLFGATIIGPMIVTAILSLSGLIHHRPPAEAILLAQFMIGTGIGVGYVGVTLHELRKDVLAGVMFVLILAVMSVLMTVLVVELGLANPVEALLSFAPGGQAEMTVLAIVSGADLGFVVVHHLVRVFLVITCAPLAGKIMAREDNRQTRKKSGTGKDL